MHSKLLKSFDSVGSAGNKSGTHKRYKSSGNSSNLSSFSNESKSSKEKPKTADIYILFVLPFPLINLNLEKNLDAAAIFATNDNRMVESLQNNTYFNYPRWKAEER